MIWEKKIQALLHDPIEKALDITNHEKIADKRLFKLNTYIKDKNYDYLSSSADRILFPKEREHFSRRFSIDINQHPEYIHPLTGEKLEDYFNEEFKKIIRKIDSEKITEKIEYIDNDHRKSYYKLWWELPDLLNISYMLPADTRVPSHSIIDHLDSASAMSVSNNLSLILVSIGPVQEFIAAGRSTIDLKVGSYILSYLVFQGIKVIGEKYGYDNIIFPYMRGNYFVKKELEKLGLFLSTTADPSVASLPNVFTAIVPTKDINELKEEVNNAIKNEMNKISEYIKKYIKNNANEKIKIKVLSNFDKWDEQVSQFPTIMIVEQKIANLEESIKDHYNYTKDEKIKNLYEELKKLENTYTIKDISFYGMYSELLGIKSTLRKATRDFNQLYENSKEHGDDISGSNKALIEIETIYENESKIEKLSALSAIKRFFVEYLKEINYTEAYEKLKDIRSTEKIADKYKLAVLLMDGDNMGKWISGNLAPSIKDRLHSKIVSEMKKDNEDYIKILEEIKFVTPAYQRMISRTLNHFSNFVPKIVEEFNGLLIYAGGDDVLALFPSNKVFNAANKLRKVYSGIGNEKIDNYEFKNGWCYLNNIPVFNMMGKNATMSVGITISKHNFNLKLALNKAREMEKFAKSNEEGNIKKNSFAIATIRRSGQVNQSRSFWDIDYYDVLAKSQEFITKYENKKSIKNLITRLKNEYQNFCLDEMGNEIMSIKDFRDNVIPFIEKRMQLKLKDEIKIILADNMRFNKDKFIDFMITLENIEYSRRENKYED
ncbi:type III-B CRISPR-associated protein Cas10/Cmr2 [Marinitoga sp. 38H-ov]|uniref:type III-B CRISPR-associated protein Cas10/Cmr2 n=1 Tax=Marinitoga sp. 38H-ov TaxID=1755814 RepID=UPI0013EA868F|nr:type III-B CRISPR-associated protein Cas10/Cmr2 [Marinitoga sp. 38H-ov]KAF2956643.1 type III-B CRISPR-associated protein Cas10/Cmr2 [Marinitoga sp. 38H-ov]